MPLEMFEGIANNANRTLNSPKSEQQKKAILKVGVWGLCISSASAVLTFVLGWICLFTKLDILMFPLFGLSILGLVGAIGFLVVTILGGALILLGAGVKMLDTTSFCPYCHGKMSYRDTECPSCGRRKGEDDNG